MFIFCSLFPRISISVWFFFFLRRKNLCESCMLRIVRTEEQINYYYHSLVHLAVTVVSGQY